MVFNTSALTPPRNATDFLRNPKACAFVVASVNFANGRRCLSQLPEQLRRCTLAGAVHHVEDCDLLEHDVVGHGYSINSESGCDVEKELTFFDTVLLSLAVFLLLLLHALGAFVVMVLQWRTLRCLQAFWKVQCQPLHLEIRH